ncbi:pantoate--beta-alanine ligase [Bacillus sp. FJAT-49736]|uniref:pantoate--beta-alanine ligase n=1 Tax=Bacillus sp. FJAT-49736 TaxID=2833582 RepID=UPI001BC9AB59|nr:pantoate--beta-alanine ligase [Bacillus sp. FJAT-49736]MBS4173249.1 pantoate--beta-alanine ligase [Bacillus sp. FJAT-49736]
MRVITTRKEMQEIAFNHKQNGEKVGFVPTMGFLHEGHLTLAKKARKDNDVVVMSIFVNPLQFGPNEDFETYPRDIKRDEKLAKDAGVDYLFVPSVEEMYPTTLSIQLSVQKRVNVLCGKKREGHFDGVVTVLTKLFHLILPNKVYFGLKDAQQVAVVDSLINDFFFPIELVAVETVREDDGLAKSSRNVYLSDQERIEAVQLHKGLQMAKVAISNGEKNVNNIIMELKKHIQTTTSGKIDYIEIYQYPSLEPLNKISGKIIIALAVHFSKARLIDNLILKIN